MYLPILCCLVACVLGGLPTISLNFEFTGSATSSDGKMSYAFRKNVGSVTYGNKRFTALCYYTQQMGSYHDYPKRLQARWVDWLGVSEDGTEIAVGYIDCNPRDLSMPIGPLWYESYSEVSTGCGVAFVLITCVQKLHYLEPASGTCAGFVDLSHMNRKYEVSLPQLKVAPSKASLDTGITIVGNQIRLDETSGWVVFPSLGNWTTSMISTVDCSSCISNCRECTRGPWWELHFFAQPQDAFDHRALFGQGMLLTQSILTLLPPGPGIYFIFPQGNRSYVQLNYTLSVPELATPSINFKATWSGRLK